MRGSSVESTHKIHAVISDKKGRVLMCAGNPEYKSFIRSALKPFQAIPFISSGAYSKINNSIDENAYLLGYSKFKTFSTIHLPYLKTNILLVGVLIALEIIKELPITLILRPFNFETFATKAYSYAAQDLLEAAAFPSLCLIFWASIFILFISKYILSEK